MFKLLSLYSEPVREICIRRKKNGFTGIRYAYFHGLENCSELAFERTKLIGIYVSKFDESKQYEFDSSHSFF